MANAIMLRPFPLEFEAAGLRDRLEVALEFQSSADGRAQQGVREVLTAFARLAGVGGLAGRDLDPAQAGLTLESSRVDERGSAWIFRDVRIDPASQFLLSNMLHYVHLQDTPLRLARVRWPELAQAPGLTTVRFPERWHRPSFRLDIGNLLDDIDVDIEFATLQNPDTAARVVDAMAAWLLATHRGAYADDAFDPSKTAVFLGPDVMSVSPDRITWFIEVLRCNESALDGLVNVLEWTHKHVAPINRVEIGP